MIRDDYYPVRVRPLHLLSRKMLYPRAPVDRVMGALRNRRERGKLNLLVLGASGHVARAVLRRLAERRGDFARLLLLDRCDSVLRDPVLPHGELNYTFYRQELSFPHDAAGYGDLLRREGVEVVLDLTDMDSLPVLEATDEAGVSYVNTALNDSRRGIASVLARVLPSRKSLTRAPHILSSGMNPGVVNVMAWHAVRQFGKPREIIHFEYDTAVPKSGWRPMITWSRQEFLTEVVWERTGVVRDGKVELFGGNGLEHRESLGPILAPICPGGDYPEGFTVLHEENVKLGVRLGISSRYIYAVHPRTMGYLAERHRAAGTVEVEELEVGDNTRTPLTGEDLIGVLLRYPDRQVYYVHRLANEAVRGTNATCAQVAFGVEAALSTLMTESLACRIHFATDLFETGYTEWIFSNMEIEQYCFEVGQPGRSGNRRERWAAGEPVLAESAEVGI